MNRQDYRDAFDAVDFSPDFEERTLQKLAAARQASEKEQNMISMNRMKKTALLVAAAVALLAVSVSAAMLWLTPAQVADRVEEPLLAEAFQSEDAIVLDESVTAGDYQITLAGMVSGEDLSVPTDYNGEIVNDRTYAVFRVARADGEPLTDYPNLSYSPLVDGYHVRCVNAWTLGTTTQQFIEDGVIYCLFDCRNLEMFADHPVRFAIYEGGVPNTDLFSMAEDGTISLRENVVGAMFTLPLDESKADPAAAQAFVESTGLVWEPMTDAELAAREEETAQEDARITAPETYGSVEVIEVPGHGLVTTIQAQAAAEYEAFMERETARLAQEVAAGTLSESDYEAAVQEMEDSLAGLWDGTRSPTWHANPDDTEILQTQPSAAALAEQAGSMG